MSKPLAEDFLKCCEKIITESDSDWLLFNSEISAQSADVLINQVRRHSHSHKNVILLLTTNGGDVNAAYRIARFLQKRYEKFILFIIGYCKSAGSLIALGADELVMSDFGELGPLDVQVYREDELLSRGSGLDLPNAIQFIGHQAFYFFEQYLLEIIKRSRGVITTKTAADIACSMAIGLLSPISGQIDPTRLGELNRIMRITQEYGKRLCKGPLTDDRIDTIMRFVGDYPSHDFVIDKDEAKELLGNVREPTELEKEFEDHLLEGFRAEGKDTLVACLNCMIEDKRDGKEVDELGGSKSQHSKRATPPDNGKSTANEQAPNATDERQSKRSTAG